MDYVHESAATASLKIERQSDNVAANLTASLKIESQFGEAAIGLFDLERLNYFKESI
jgi:hypothetical protein